MRADPLERIERTFDAGGFQQAALMLDQMEAVAAGRAQRRSERAHTLVEPGEGLS